MSLISAASEKTEIGSGTLRDSVYQTSGRPLSKEALYRAKLKYGVFESPAKGLSSGVVDSKVASDTAANHANNNQTAIEAYKRLLNPNASKAASAVSELVNGNKTASKVKVQGSYNRGVKENAAAAAATAAPVSSRSRASSVGQTSVASSNVGVLPVNSRTPKVNISKVLAGAEKNAATHIDQRINPETFNYVKGVSDRNVGKAAGASFSITSEMIEKLHTKEEYVQAAEKEALSYEMAQSAADAIKDYNPVDITDKNWRKREEDKRQMIKYLSSDQVLAKAKERAQEKLSNIDRECANSFLYRNVEFNKAAYAKAKENLTISRSAASQLQNKVNVGGGLWISEDDIDNIAKEMIAPILDEVHERTTAQRAMDIDIEKRTILYNENYDKWVQLQISRQKNDATLPLAQEERHKSELSTLEASLESKFQKLCASKDEEVATWETKLKAKHQEMENLKQSLEEKLNLRHEKLISDHEALEASNAMDLAQAKEEQEVILEPLRTELEAAKSHHIQLNEEREKIKKEIEDFTLSIENHKAHVVELQQQIDENAAKIFEENETLRQLSDETTNLKDELEVNYVAIAEKAKEEAKISSEEARIKQLNVDAMINERQVELTNTELQLKKEKLALVESMRHVAELKGDDALDEEKVKAFVGTSSEQFLSQYKEVEAAKVQPEIEDSKSLSRKETIVSAPSEPLGTNATPPEAPTSKIERRKSLKRFLGLKSSTDASTSQTSKSNFSSSKPKKDGENVVQSSNIASHDSSIKDSGNQNEAAEDDDEYVLKEQRKSEKRKSLFREIF